jgi:hypothetical protein
MHQTLARILGTERFAVVVGARPDGTPVLVAWTAKQKR